MLKQRQILFSPFPCPLSTTAKKRILVRQPLIGCLVGVLVWRSIFCSLLNLIDSNVDFCFKSRKQLTSNYKKDVHLYREIIRKIVNNPADVDCMKEF